MNALLKKVIDFSWKHSLEFLNFRVNHLFFSSCTYNFIITAKMEVLDLGTDIIGADDKGKSPCIAVNGHGQVVMTFERDGAFHYKVGTVDKSNKIAWRDANLYGKFVSSLSVAINNKGFVFTVFEDKYSRLNYCVGKVCESTYIIEWGETTTEYDRGTTPSVAINDQGEFVEVHKASGHDIQLFYRTG